MKYLLHHKSMHPATFYADAIEDVKVQVRRWIALVCSPGTSTEEFRLEVCGKEPCKTSAMESTI